MKREGGAKRGWCKERVVQREGGAKRGWCKERVARVVGLDSNTVECVGHVTVKGSALHSFRPRILKPGL
jgi:hypothetical protein